MMAIVMLASINNPRHLVRYARTFFLFVYLLSALIFNELFVPGNLLFVFYVHFLFVICDGRVVSMASKSR